MAEAWVRVTVEWQPGDGAPPSLAAAAMPVDTADHYDVDRSLSIVVARAMEAVNGLADQAFDAVTLARAVTHLTGPTMGPAGDPDSRSEHAFIAAYAAFEAAARGTRGQTRRLARGVTPMTDEQALLAAIRATPDDDVPRVVFADWLREPGRTVDQEARGDFIQRHIQERVCAMRFLSTTTIDVEEHYWTCYPMIDGSEEWCGPWWADAIRAELYRSLPILPYMSEVGFARGFVASVTCPAAAWLAHGDAVCERHPVERVSLTTMPAVGFRDRNHVYLISGGEDNVRDGVPFWREDIDGARRDDFDVRRAVTSMLSLRWPGVAFTLPEREVATRVIRVPNEMFANVPADMLENPDDFAAAPDPGEPRRNSRRRSIPDRGGPRFPRAR